MNAQQHCSAIELSLVSPARNEEETIRRFVQQVADGLEPSGIRFELIVVDDGSTDQTAPLAIDCQRTHPWLRILQMQREPRDHGCGKSAALRRGIEAAAGDSIAFIDADGQNDVRDLIRMLQLLKQSRCDMVHGDRSGHRRDNWRRRLSSIAATGLRQLILRDGIRDSACGLLVMTRELALALPLQFTGVHRFLPCYGKLAGRTVLQVPVAHHPRMAGTSKYGFGNRVVRSLIDMLALSWMRRRFKMSACKELRPASRENFPNETAAPAVAASNPPPAPVTYAGHRD